MLIGNMCTLEMFLCTNVQSVEKVQKQRIFSVVEDISGFTDETIREKVGERDGSLLMVLKLIFAFDRHNYETEVVQL